jgi:LasA protease
MFNRTCRDPALDVIMLRVRRLVLVLALASSITPLAAQLAQPADGPQKPAPTDPLTVFAEEFSSRWIEDSEFVYGPALLDFDLRAYLAASAPHLLPHAEAMSHWAGYYSISPKLLLALLEMQSSVWSVATSAAMANPTAGLAAGSEFNEQIRTLLMGLTVDFYAFREASGGRSTAMNAATFALLNAFRAVAPNGLSAAEADDLRRRFLDASVRLFPMPVHGAALTTDVDRIGPPAAFMQLPWKHNQAWFFNGVHTQTGSDPGVMNSIDFARSFQLDWGANTSTDYVVAAHAGTVTVFSTCNLRVTSPNGWATNYYHLSNVVVSSGTQVNANDTIGVYANAPSQALCQGGQSTRPHLHFSLFQNGVFAPLDGAQLGGYLVHAGRFSYDIDPNYMWLQSVATGTRHYAGRSALVSTPVASDAPGPPTNLTAAVTGLTFTLTWTAASGAPATDYVLEAAGTSAFTPVLFGPASIGATTTATLTAPPGTSGTFHLRVSARNANGTSAPSNVVTATFSPDTTAPGRPGAPVVHVMAGGSVFVSWLPPASGPAPTGYRLSVTLGGAPFPGSPFTLPASTAVLSPGPLPPGPYSLTVSALVGTIEGPPSPPASFVIPGAPMASATALRPDAKR